MVVVALALDVLLVLLAFAWAALALFHPTRLRWLGRGALFTGLALVGSSALTGVVVAEAWRTVAEIELGVDARTGYLGYASAVAQAEAGVERHALAVLATAVLVGGAALSLRLRSRSARALVPAGLTLAFAELLAAPAIVVIRRNATMRPDATDATQSLLSAREAAQEVLLEGRVHVGVSVLAGGLTVMLALAAARARGHDPFRRARPSLEHAGYALFALGLAAFGLTRRHAHDAQLALEPDERACPSQLREHEIEALPTSDFEPEGPEGMYLLRIVDDEGQLGGVPYRYPYELRAHLDRLEGSPWGDEPRAQATVLVSAASYPSHTSVRWIDELRGDHRVRALVRLPDRHLETRTFGSIQRRPRCASTELGVAYPRVGPEPCRLSPHDNERKHWGERPLEPCQNRLAPLHGAAP